MRDPKSTGNEIQEFVNEIVNFVDNVVYESNETFGTHTSSIRHRVRLDAEDVLAVMGEVRDKLSDLGEDVGSRSSSTSVQSRKLTRQKLANLSYEIAKYAKELLDVLDV